MRRTDPPLFRSLIPALGLWLAFSGPALGQAEAVQQPQAGNVTGPAPSEAGQTTEPMDEIVVTGRRSVTALIREGEDLTEDFYMRLNDVLDNDDFRISCETERRMESNIMIRVCRTGFQRRLGRYEAASVVQSLTDMQNQEAMQESLGEPTAVGPLQIDNTFGADVLRWQAEFQDAILNAVNTDPVLNQQVNRLLVLKSAIESYQSPRELRRERRRAQGDSQGIDDDD